MIVIETQKIQNDLIDKITAISFNAGMKHGMEKMCDNVLRTIHDNKHLNPAKQVQYLAYYIKSVQQKLNDIYSNENKEGNDSAEENT